MNKIKEALYSLRTYLGRDEEGLRRLAIVTAVANDMRKTIATLTTEAQEKADSARKAIADRDAISAAASIAKADADSERAKRRQLERDLEVARQRIVQLETDLQQLLPVDLPDLPESLAHPDGVSPLVRDPIAFSRMVNTLRREIRVAPSPTLRRGTYELTDIMRSYGTAELCKLGRFTAALALLNMHVSIVACENYGTSKYPGVLHAKRTWINEDTGALPAFIRWFRSNVCHSDNREMTYKRSARVRKDINGFWL